jgi:Beta-galactosidase
MRNFRNKRNAILIPGMICLLLVGVMVGIGLKILSGSTANTANTQGKTKTLPTGIRNVQYPNFKGLYQFTANNSSINSDKPYLAGNYLGYYWSQLEPLKGQYDWSIIDQNMQPWTSHGKKVILRISTSGWARWNPPYSGEGTPGWVYDMGVPSVTENDGSILPQYWNPIFLQNLDDFVHAFALKYDGNPNIAYIEIGIGVGGEAKVDSHDANPNQLQLWQQIGYTDPIWWGAVQQIITAYTSNFTKTPLAIMADKTFMGKTKGYTESSLLNYAVQHGLWIQDNGLWSGRKLPPQFMAVPHPEEQSQPTSQSGDTLQGDIQRALELGANYILVFGGDTSNPANQATLQQAASQAAAWPLQKAPA